MFADEIKATYMLHIPHSSTNLAGYESDFHDNLTLHSEIAKCTDWMTDSIFDPTVLGLPAVVCFVSRIICDVERLLENEPMEAAGRGVIYKLDRHGKELRKQVSGNPIEEFYKPHHSKLTELCTSLLQEHGVCRIVDCHSFNDKPLPYEADQTSARPDICLGVDDFHTPHFMTHYFRKFFKDLGLSVEVNTVYSGTIVPLQYLNNNPKVQSIMIEVNKRLYMNDNGIVDYVRTKVLQDMMKKLFEFEVAI